MSIANGQKRSAVRDDQHETIQHAADFLFNSIGRRKKFLGADRIAGPYQLFVAIIHGAVHNRPYDLYSLATWSNLPRSSCQRIAASLIEQNLVIRTKEGRRYLYLPSKKGQMELIQYYLDAKKEMLSVPGTD